MGADSRCHFGWLALALILAFLLVPFSVTAQVTFERTYGGVDEDAGCSVQQTQNGGYVIAGWTGSFGSADVYLIKTDSVGDTIWTRTYGGPADDWGYAVQQAQDGGYIIAGSMFSLGGRIWDVYMVKTNSLGDSMWNRIYGGFNLDEAYSVRQTRDRGYVVAGRTHSFGVGSGEVCMIKTDSLGDSVWARTYGGADLDEGRSVEQTQDSGYIIAGWTWSFGAGSEDVYLIKTDSVGDTIWTRTYGGIDNDAGYSVQQTEDGGYIVAGWTASFGAASADVYLIKTNSLGNSVWTRTYGGASRDLGYSVRQTQDGGYIIGGVTESFGAGSGDVYLIKTDSVGDTIWTRTYGGVSVDLGRSAQQTEDGGYVIAGCTESFGAGSYDVYLIKTDENGLTGLEESARKSSVPQRSFQLFQNSPNPFHWSTAISYSLPQASRVTLAIYDITGRLVETLVNETREPGIHQIRWDRAGNPSGVYFYRLRACPERSPEPGEGQSRRADDFVETRKMVVID